MCETVEAFCHHGAGLLVGNVAPSFEKDDLSGDTVEASCHFCADIFV